ncbi:MAG: regulatory protein GemA [Candidatus Symbiothrix sp.]|jgi:hypothetical protein|nr:regulatory protein GemA [Candidatus Symbiothrix sp.]
MMTITDKQFNGLLKKYHAICRQLKMDEDARMDMLMNNYGVTSSVELDFPQLLELCGILERQARPELAVQDKWRKRLMKSIGVWMENMGRESNAKLIKATACRAAGVDDFNRIPVERLRSLYNAFNKKNKDLEWVGGLTAEALLNKINLN